MLGLVTATLGATMTIEHYTNTDATGTPDWTISFAENSCTRIDGAPLSGKYLQAACEFGSATMTMKDSCDEVFGTSFPWSTSSYFGACNADLVGGCYKVTCGCSHTVVDAITTGGCTRENCPEDIVEEACGSEACKLQLGGQTFSDCDAYEDSKPCFDRETAVCRLLDERAAAPAAYSACWGESAGAGKTAERALMTDLVAGDIVLSGDGSFTRVLVNQHRAATGKMNAMLSIATPDGQLSLTPDHVLLADKEYKPASDVLAGMALSSGARVVSVTRAAGGVVNPLTASGTVLAAGPGSAAPVAAATYPSWVADYMLDRGTASFSRAAAYLFPATAQAYYDDMVEPLFPAAGSSYRSLLEALTPLAPLAFAAGDVAVAGGFMAYLLLHSAAAVATAALAAAAVVAARAATKPTLA